MQEPRLSGFFLVLLEEFIFSLIVCNVGGMDLISKAH